MAQSLTLAQVNAITKTYFIEEGAIYESDTYDNQFFRLTPKMVDASGDTIKQPLLDGQIAGGSGDHDTAMGAITAGSQVAFVLPWCNRYQGALLNDKLARLTTTQRGGFIEAKELAIKSAGSHFNDCTEYGLLRSSNGAMGVVGSGSNGPVWSGTQMTITCTGDTSQNVLQRIKTNGTVPNPAASFATANIGGTVLNFSAGGPIGQAAGASGPLQAGDWVVTSIGDTTFTVAPLNGAVMITGSAYFYAKGDAQNQASGSNIVASFFGVQDWQPSVLNATNYVLGGVDRSVNTLSRAGQRVSPLASVHESLIQGGNKAMQRGSKITHIFMHQDRFNDLINELQEQKRYFPGSAKQQGSAAMPKGLKLSASDAARFGFDAVTLSQYAGRTIAIVPTWACPTNMSFMVDITKYKFRHTKEGYPYNAGTGMDGQDWFRQTSGANWLLELFGIAQLTNSDPSKMVTVLHSPTLTA